MWREPSASCSKACRMAVRSRFLLPLLLLFVFYRAAAARTDLRVNPSVNLWKSHLLNVKAAAATWPLSSLYLLRSALAFSPWTQTQCECWRYDHMQQYRLGRITAVIITESSPRCCRCLGRIGPSSEEEPWNILSSSIGFVRLVISIYIYGENMQANEAEKLEEREAKVVPGGALWF